jgi:hypothetical protein
VSSFTAGCWSRTAGGAGGGRGGCLRRPISGIACAIVFVSIGIYLQVFLTWSRGLLFIKHGIVLVRYYTYSIQTRTPD